MFDGIKLIRRKYISISEVISLSYSSPDWKMFKVSGPMVGNCFTTQYLLPVESFDLNILFYIKRAADIQLFVHNPGES